MAKIVKLEIPDTGNKLANLVLLFNKFLEYAEVESGLSPSGTAKFISVFEQSSKLEKE